MEHESKESFHDFKDALRLNEKHNEDTFFLSKDLNIKFFKDGFSIYYKKKKPFMEEILKLKKLAPYHKFIIDYLNLCFNETNH